MRSIIKNPHDKEITKRSPAACLGRVAKQSATIYGGALFYATIVYASSFSIYTTPSNGLS